MAGDSEVGSDAESERRVEQLLETESVSEARDYAERAHTDDTNNREQERE